MIIVYRDVFRNGIVGLISNLSCDFNFSQSLLQITTDFLFLSIFSQQLLLLLPVSNPDRLLNMLLP